MVDFIATAFIATVVIASASLLVIEAYRFAREKFSRRPYKTLLNPFLDGSAHALLGVIAVACIFALWMDRYRFDHMILKNGESYPVRINRLTGTSQVLYRGTWRPAADVKSLPPLIQDLSPQDLQKLTGSGKLDELQMFYLDLYNGSDFALKEITVEFVVSDSHKEEALRRSYRFRQEHPSKQDRSYTEDVNFTVGPQQSWSWKITAAKGIKD